MTATASPPPTAAPGSLQQSGDRSLRPPELTVPQMFERTLAIVPDKPALMHKAGGKFQPITYKELDQRVRALALGFLALGVQPGARVSLLCENRPEWAVVDLAALSVGAVNVPMYYTLPAPQVEYIVRDAGAEVLVVSTQKQLAKVLEIRANLPGLKHVVVIDAPEELPEGVLTLQHVVELGQKQSPEEYERRRKAVKPHDLASIIYTSGTTGDPKGAMLSHDNFMSNAQAAAKLVGISQDDVFLSFLPLSHVFERLAGHYFPLLVGATIAYAESVFTIPTNLQEVKPTIMASVPRLYESFQSRILDAIGKLEPKKRKMADWAVAAGWAYNSKFVRGERPGLFATLQYRLADRLVLEAMRSRVTGGRMRFFVSGGAPLPFETAKFLTSIGLRLLEGYGLTETSPVIAVNLPQRTKLGMVGPAVTGVEIRIAADGEILSRGPHIMLGYYNRPEETAQAIDADGWFHTGDIGVLDEEGYLRITDRKKDILVLANGKNVAPQPIEAKLKASTYIANAVLFGDRQPQVVALIVPDFDHLKQWARQKGIEEREPEALVKSAEVKKLIKAEIERNTKDLADFEKVRRFAMLARDFTMERGELTPTMKIKRRVVAESCKAEIQSMYGGRSEE